MPKRHSANPTRRLIAQQDISKEMIEVIFNHAKYISSGHHKRYPANYGFKVTNPRLLCDIDRVIKLEEAEVLSKNGIKHGMFSTPLLNGMPKYIWSVSDNSEVYESKTDPNTPWLYHGYPLTEEDSMCLYIFENWRIRSASMEN
ncbi:hypothetical protein D5085_10725 [Ectothiorhodospiraceae bacterium BW-2]|nr:hypothetical protein D5085_10725 [Ectothiorhodospiraceae bacterium BW-2]